MKIAFACAVAIVGMLAFSSNIPNAKPTGLTVNKSNTGQTSQNVVDTVANTEQFPELPFSDNELGEEARNFLFDINGGSSAPQLMQESRTLPQGWTADDPLDLTGEMPSDGDIRGAIVKAINYLLDRQNENGSWDVVLEGTLLSQIADEAVDAIAATALAGISLRYHMAVDPAKLAAASKKAADFIIDRVYRGKLPLNVKYANWRYNLGLKFLHLEYKASDSDERKSEIRSVCRRMVQAMMKLQLSNSEAGTLEKKRKTKVSSRFKGMDQPCQLGVVLELPTDDNYRGGAPIVEIIPGTTADEQGFKVGDRIIEAEGLRVENAVDFYMMEPDWVAGQRVAIKIRRDGGKDTTKNIQLDPTWPAIIGVKGENVSTGVQVTGFYPFSEAKGELEIGDIIFAVNKVPVANTDDMNSFESGLNIGDKVKVEVYRGAKRKKKKESFKVGAAPEGSLVGRRPEQIFVSEDKEDANGVVLLSDPAPGTLAGDLGLKKDDRIVRIGNLPLLGYDHLIYAYYTLPSGRSVKITWLRNGEEMSAEGTPSPLVRSGDTQFEWVYRNQIDLFRPGVVKSVEKDGIAAKAGIKAKDVVTHINGTEMKNLYHSAVTMNSITAGEEVEITLTRKSKSFTVTLELAKVKETADVGNEEGGWAYYPDMKESPSFCTATGMLALMDIESDLEIRGLRRALKDPLMSAARLLNSLRAPDASGLNGKSETYAYRAGSINPKKKAVDLRGSQGRNAVCEMTLYKHGKMKRGKSHLKKIVDQFIDHRGQLDAVRRMEFYAPPRMRGSPHNFHRYNNAAYYWLFGHYHTIQASKIVGKKHFKKLNEICVKSLMQTRQDDGTWLGHPAFGPICGTSLALWILGETEGGWKEGYNNAVETQPGKEGSDPSEPKK